MIGILSSLSLYNLAFIFWMLVVVSRWKECSTFIAARSRRKSLPCSYVHLYPTSSTIQSDVANRLFFQDDQDDAEDVDMYDGQYYDGEYNLDLFGEENINPSSKENQEKEDVSNDTVNVNLRRWFKSRNRQQPILFGDLFEEHEKSAQQSGTVKDPPLIPIEDYKWFEPTLKEIEYKFDKRKEQLLSSLNTDRKSTPNTVPIHANEILEKLLEEEMQFEIKSKLKQMREERNTLIQEEQVKAQKLEELYIPQALEVDVEPNIEQSVNTPKHSTLEKEREKRGQSFDLGGQTSLTYGYNEMKDYDSSANEKLGQMLSKQPKDSTEQIRMIEKEIVEMRAYFEKMKKDSIFRPENYVDWKKYQEIKAEEKELNSGEPFDEEVIVKRFLDWKEFTMRQDRMMEIFLEDEKIIDDELEDARQVITEPEQDFDRVVADINRKSLKVLEDILEKRGRGPHTKDLEDRINKLRNSLEAVNYVDIQPFEKNTTVSKIIKDKPVNFTEIFPAQAARMKVRDGTEQNAKELEETSGGILRQGFADVEELLRKDMLSDDSVMSRTTRSKDRLSPNIQSVSDDVEEVVQKIPNTPFFTSEQDDVQKPNTFVEEEDYKPQKPKTPFFSDEENAGEEKDGGSQEETKDNTLSLNKSDINKRPEERSTSLLGTYDEQRMKNFYRQGGAKTEDEQLKAKEEFELFQRYQEEKMKQMESLDETNFDIGYNISDVLTEDGSIDADKILSFINAKRKISDAQNGNSSSKPNAKEIDIPSVTSGNIEATYDVPAEKKIKKEGATETLGGDFLALTGESDINLPAEQRSTSLLGTYEEQRMKNLYRQSGTTGDAEKEMFQEKYDSFLRYQEERMKQLEEGDLNVDIKIEEMITEDGNDIDAAKILSAIDKKLTNTTENASSVMESDSVSPDVGNDLLTKQGNLLEPEVVAELPNPSSQLQNRDNHQPDSDSSSRDFEHLSKNQIDDESGMDTLEAQKAISLGEEEMRGEIDEIEEGYVEGLKEQKDENEKAKVSTRGTFLGQEELSLNNDEEEEEIEDFEENKRRIEEVIGVKTGAGEIDIYEILGRRPGDSYDDDDDFKSEEYYTRDSNADLSDYHSRKEALLGRKNINLFEVNMLMDLKDSIETHGISPYMAKITKPFREFGAIFRLEGVLVDISTLEGRAWRRVAEKIKMRIPLDDDIRAASVQTPEYSVRRIFSWTSDYSLCSEIARIHDRYLKDEVKASLYSQSTEDDLSHTKTDYTLDEQNQVKSIYITLADKYGLKQPTDSELNDAVGISAARAVKDVFDWAQEEKAVANLVAALKEFFNLNKDGISSFLSNIETDLFPEMEEDLSSAIQDTDIVLIDGVKSWIKALQEVEMPCGLVSYLDDEIVALILREVGLADFFPSESRATSTNGFDRDSQLQLVGSLLIDRRPNMCILFDGNAEGLSSARENEMKSVGITSIYPAYELLAADTTARNFEYLTAMNIRRLFGERENQEPMLQTYVKQPTRAKRKVKTMYPEEDDNKERRSDDRHYSSDYDQDRYYGDEEYLPPRYSDVPDGGVLYDDDNNNDLFQ